MRFTTLAGLLSAGVAIAGLSGAAFAQCGYGQVYAQPVYSGYGHVQYHPPVHYQPPVHYHTPVVHHHHVSHTRHVSHTQRVVVARPVYHPPVYHAPRPVYHARPVYVPPSTCHQPVYYGRVNRGVHVQSFGRNHGVSVGVRW